MTPKLTKEDRLKIILRVEKGESISKVCVETGISRVLFYRWYKKYKEEGLKGLDPGEAGRPQKSHTPKKAKEYTVLSPHARGLMVKEVVDQNQEPSEVALRYNISRVTLYKWINRYKKDLSKGFEPDMSSRKPYVERYFRQVPERHELAVIQLIEQHPEWGIRRIVANLPQVGGMPIVGHHGVQNILDRHNLSTYELRLAYARSRVTPVTEGIGGILDKVSDFFKVPPAERQTFIKNFTRVSVGGLSIIVVLGFIGLVAHSYTQAAGISPVGLIFATVALFMGMIFLVYSLKYYFSIAMVLSFSQGQDKVVKKRGIGLTPDLSHLKLTSRPYVSVQIPFYNEKYVVERAMQAATNFDYPEYEVILCDDSTDETTGIIANYLKANAGQVYKKTGEGWELTWGMVRKGVTLKHLHRTTRGGYKGGALDLALKLADPRTEYVSIFDADFVPYPDTLELFLKYFQAEGNKPEIAAVQGYQWHVLNKSENWITRGVRSEYAGSYVIERSGIEIYGGLKQISGSVYMIKKNALQEIGWGTSITEDFELTLRLYNAGYKVLYTPYVQAPAECVSTIRRLIRQRMRWAEGHSANIKKMFWKLLGSPKLSLTEKFEFAYLSPYYLQAFFFLVGTICWFVSETIFKARLPFWTELWGWSLILTNMISLPLLNAVGMFLEESGNRDYLGLMSFVALSYILVPFQAYASVKGLLEEKEGPWFRTPKTGRITDVFRRGKFYKFISGILPGKSFGPVPVAGSPEPQTAHDVDANYYMNLATANSKFNAFEIKPIKIKWLSKAVLSVLLSISVTMLYLVRDVPMVYATNISAPLVFKPVAINQASETWPSWGNGMYNSVAGASATLYNFTNACCNVNGNSFKWYSNYFPLTPGGNPFILPAGAYYVNIAKRTGPPASNRLNYAIQIMLTSQNGSTQNVILSNTTYYINNTAGSVISADNTIGSHLVGSLLSNITVTSPVNRIAVRLYVTGVTSTARTSLNWIINNSTLQAQLVPPGAIQVPEIPKEVVYVIMMIIVPVIPAYVEMMTERKRKGITSKGLKSDLKELMDRILGRREKALDDLPV